MVASGYALPNPSRPGGLPIVASIVLHVAVIAGVWWNGTHVRQAPGTFKVYRVNIVSPPPQELGPPDLVTSVVPTPSPPKVSTAPAPTKPAVKVTTPKAPPAKSSASTKKKTPAKGWNPKPGAEVGGSGINVQMAGEDFPYPEYLNNIILQIHRYFRWTGTSGLQTTVYFVVMRNGTVKDIRVIRGSGSFTFDLQAQGAIEAAGNNKAFGSLPRGYEPDRLPIELTIAPPR